MANLSKLKRDVLIEKIEELKKQYATDEDTRLLLNDIITELTSKKYGIIWEEHDENVDIKMQTQIPIFLEIEEKNLCSVESDGMNFLIEGDNLHSLHLLRSTHKGKIKVIYIDPPYNTGNTFIYNDSIIGDDDDYKHSKWLSFMKRRLELAYELLEDYGVIFISINDFEGAQCKLLCDEIFGERNFVGQLTWESTTQPTNAGKARFLLQKKVESIYFYAKNKYKIERYKLREIKSNLKYPHTGKFGNCRFEIIEKSDAGAYKRDTMKFAILGQYPREGKRWQIGEATARQLEAEGKVEIVDGIVKKAVYPEDELDKQKFEPFWSHFRADDVGTAQNGKDELNTILGFAAGFDTVKPTKLIKELLSHFEDDIIILDFFAGSGTTGQAVMELNQEDGGNRRFILCTNNEGNICEDITYQRLKTVITGIKKDGSKYSDGISANLKYYKTDFVDKLSADPDYFIEDKLMEHIIEMIQLENGISIDNDKYIVLLTDEDAKDFEANIDNYYPVKVYIDGTIFLSTKIINRLEADGVEVLPIPDYYFAKDIKGGN